MEKEMAKYKFRLEMLRKMRERARDHRRAALADGFRAADLLATKQAELAAEASELRGLQRSAAAGRYLDVNRLLEAQRYELLLKARGEELAKQSALLAAEIERRRQTLVEADRDVRVLELLDERHRREHDRRQHRLDTKQLDEAALQRWNAG
jgi:flagellar export protein FliJ